MISSLLHTLNSSLFFHLLVHCWFHSVLAWRRGFIHNWTHWPSSPSPWVTNNPGAECCHMTSLGSFSAHSSTCTIIPIKQTELLDTIIMFKNRKSFKRWLQNNSVVDIVNDILAPKKLKQQEWHILLFFC